MTPEELGFIVRHAGAYGAGVIVALCVVYLVGRHALSSYLGEKGKNLATKEDIAVITEKVEQVRAPYNALLEELKARHQLRMAAVDRRLAAHQEAFTLWRELRAAVHTDEIAGTTAKCQSWWERNCLYLEPEVRSSFVRAYSAAHIHRTLATNRAEADAVSRNWDEINQFPDVLFAAVKLPPLSELEVKRVDAS